MLTIAALDREEGELYNDISLYYSHLTDIKKGTYWGAEYNVIKEAILRNRHERANVLRFLDFKAGYNSSGAKPLSDNLLEHKFQIHKHKNND